MLSNVFSNSAIEYLLNFINFYFKIKSQQKEHFLHQKADRERKQHSKLQQKANLLLNLQKQQRRKRSRNRQIQFLHPLI